MDDLLVGLGLVFVVEGMLWGLAPGLAVKMLEAAARTEERTLRFFGWAGVGIGVIIVALVRG